MELNQIWTTVFELVKKITGDVDVKNKGTLQDQVDNISATDVGLDKVGNYKAVSTESGQGLSDTEKSNARTNIGAGTSSFSGSYTDLTSKPTIPTAVAVKGNAESSYRTGNVNLTPANLGALSTTGDSKNNTVSFTSADSTTATAWTDVSTLTSGEKHSSILNKISTMFKNIRYLNSMVSTLNSNMVSQKLTTEIISLTIAGGDRKKSVLLSKKTYAVTMVYTYEWYLYPTIPFLHVDDSDYYVGIYLINETLSGEVTFKVKIVREA